MPGVMVIVSDSYLLAVILRQQVQTSCDKAKWEKVISALWVPEMESRALTTNII